MAKNSQEVLDKLQEQNDSMSNEKEQQAEPMTPSNENVEKTGEKGNPLFDKFNNYQPKDAEKDLYHVAIAKVHFSEQTGEYDGQKPYVQMFIKRDYDNFMKHANALGYTTKLLYSPINA